MNFLDFAAMTLTACTILFFFVKNTEIEASKVKIRVKNRK